MLTHIIPSKTRRKILQLFYNNPKNSFYLRHVVRETSEEVNAVKRELDILQEEKLLTRERRLNKIFYTLNPSYIFYEDFLKIFAKMDIMASLMYKNLPKLGKVKYIVVSSNFVKRVPIKEDEIYLLIVGVIVVPEVTSIISQVEGAFGRDINFTVMPEDEFLFRKKNNDPFLWRFLKHPKVMLVGSEDELLK